VAALVLASVSIPASASSSGNTPKLAPFTSMVVASLSGGTNDEELAATTLEGAYNQPQGTNRLYVVWNPDDQTWLNDNVLPGVQLTALPGQGSGPAGQLNAMLADYGKDIKGAILINPSDPDTINLATTMAGIDDAMVADPSQLPLLEQYGIPVIHSFANQSFASPAAAYQWESWSVPTDEPDQQWVHTYPAVTDGDTYQFSVQVAGTGQVFLDSYDGAEDLQSPAIDLTPAYQTLTWTATIPSDAPGGQTGNAPQLQVREADIGPVSVHVSDATVQLAGPSS
jgi:hypothetical protein